MFQGFPDVAVPASLLPTDYLGYGSMDAYPENVEAREKAVNLHSPALLFDDVLHEQIQPGTGERRNGCVKAMKEWLSPFRTSLAVGRSEPGTSQLIGGVVVEPRLKCGP